MRAPHKPLIGIAAPRFLTHMVCETTYRGHNTCLLFTANGVPTGSQHLSNPMPQGTLAAPCFALFEKTNSQKAALRTQHQLP